jgi:two-component system, cell cycle sensor histidine kinase and response regulator CckA
MAAERTTSVLIVEDERIVATDLQQSLSEIGYTPVAIASSADEAVSRATESCPDVALMDIRIKGTRDGIETATLLKTRFDVPVIYLTAHADAATVERAKHAAPYGYLVKPVNSAELRSAIEVAVFKHDLERRLREREQWFATTLRSIDSGVITVDLSGRINFMNRAAESLTGVTLAEARGKPANEVLRLLDPQGAPAVETPLDRVLREETAAPLSDAALAYAGGNGRTRVIRDSASPVVDVGALLGAVMVFRDVTEERRLEQRLELAERMASLGTMAAGVAHEINNPLAVIVANASYVLEKIRDLAVDQPTPARRQAIVDAVILAQSDLKAAATRIATIVGDLKAFFRPVQTATGEADVARAIELAVRATAHELRHRARVETHLAKTPLVALDEARLGQILVNLLLNAGHAIPPGRRDSNIVTVTAGTDAAGGAVIEVHDSGSGMTPDVRQRAFDPFFTTKPGGAGTGLGLSICHAIVTGAGGSIEIESTPGQGTTVRVVLPAAPPREVTVPAAAATAATAATVGDVAAHGRLLVVDDEELVLRVLTRILRDHDVVCTTSVQEALERIDAGDVFDLILSDVTMPNASGIDFYEAVRQRDPDLAKRMVFMSGGAITAGVENFLRTIPNARIDKPFEPRRLLAKIEELLGAMRGRESSAVARRDSPGSRGDAAGSERTDLEKRILPGRAD